MVSEIVDTVLDDCFQLISLFFLTIGRNNEAPAAYEALPSIVSKTQANHENRYAVSSTIKVSLHETISLFIANH